MAIEFKAGSSKPKQLFNILCSYEGYVENKGDMLFPYLIKVKCLYTGKNYHFKFIRNNKKSPKIKEYLFDEKSSVFLQKGDLLCLDHCLLPNKENDNEIIIKWLNVVRNKYKDDSREIFKSKGRILNDKIIDKETKKETNILKIEFISHIEKIKLKKDDFEGNLIKIAKLLQNTSDSLNKRKYLMIHNENNNMLDKIYQKIIVNEEKYENKVDNNIDNIIANILEYSKSYVADVETDKIVNVVIVEQYFLGQMFKLKINSKYAQRLDFLLNKFKNKKYNQNSKNYEFKENCLFDDCFISVAKRENGTEYINYFDVYRDFQSPDLVDNIIKNGIIKQKC